MFLPLLFLFLIPSIISLSSQEDLNIIQYSHIGCLILKSDKQFLINNIQESFLLPYQTFSSPNMTIDLCFRICRRWYILLFNNKKTCICLYTINKLYEINKYLGEILPNDNCTIDNIEIYSLTENFDIIPLLLLTSTNYDWSFDGCYYLHGIQTVRVNLWLTHVDYIQAIDLCRKHCQTSRIGNNFSYFLSRKKSCYCLPLQLSQTIKTIALRKPLRHCSFHPYICQGFSNSCEKYHSDTSLDTLIKINVQYYCLSTESISFLFDKIFNMCFKSILLSSSMTFSNINYEQKCLSLTIKTIEQWNYLIQSSWITHPKIFISITENSTYIFDDLFKSNNLTLLTDNLCIVIYRTDLNKISYELIKCNEIDSPGYILCVQNPFSSTIVNEEDFHNINNISEIINDEILSCPLDFILFNNKCYYIHLSFIYSIRSGEQLCYKKNSNSTLVKFDIHDWGNINATKFLGRTYDDILLEIFYYFLDKNLNNQTINTINRKHWLRLLIGDKNDPNECVLRYFARTSGAFTIFHRCNNGGHPICQSEPIRTKIQRIIPISTSTFSTKNNSFIESITLISIANSTDLSTTTTTTISICENCTTKIFLADEDLINNETIIDTDFSNNTLKELVNTETKTKPSVHRPLIIILSGPVLALIILIVGTSLLIRHIRKNHGSYSTHSSLTGSRRTKRSSTILTTGDVPSTPAVLYTRLKPPQISSTETDMLLPLDNNYLIETDENIELMPATKIQLINNDNQIKENNENNEEILYTTLN